MNASSSSPHTATALAAQARELFVTRVAEQLQALTQSLPEHLSNLLNETRDPREVQKRRDAWIAFPNISAAWVKQVLQDWSAMEHSSGNTLSSNLGGLEGLSLIEDDSVENKIIASRMALRLIDKVSWDLNDLTVRMKALENTEELSKKDVLRPESLATALLDAWQEVGMERNFWPLVQDPVLDLLCEKLPGAYKEINALLISRNVMKEIDLRQMVKRTPSGGGASGSIPNSGSGALVSDSAPTDNQPSPAGMQQGNMGGGGSSSAPYTSSHAQGSMPGQAGWGQSGASRLSQSTVIEPSPPPMVPGAPASRHFGFSLGAIRHHAENVMGGLKRVLTQRVGMPNLQRTQAAPSPQLLEDLEPAGFDAIPPAQAALLQAVPYDAPPAGGYAPVHLHKAQEALREHSNALKKMTNEKAEKAIIELVALIFQNIISEDRIPPSIRIWIARLQMPVLRLALEEPEFFESLDHPARKLLDHLGSCVLGFTGDTPNAELEQEVKRIVQVIEQYPETGKRVFELVYGEFKKFLEKHLVHQSDAATRMVSLASQVEEKESLVIKYTIDLRDQLSKLALRDEVRDFLFRTWSQVLAVSTMKFGAQAAQTMAFKQFTPDLIWAAGAKPSRADRQKAIAEVPQIMACLRAGMKLINSPDTEQQSIIESINTVLTDAFMSKTEPIDQEVLAALSQRLANLEDYVTDTDLGRELPLDAESIEMVLGIDTSGLNLVTGEGSPDPSEDIKAWMQSLLLGSWHRLDHNGNIDRVQFCWRSAQSQLYLFVSGDGNAYLFQRKGLAAYLNTALLLPAEEEALTVIATREALGKIEANPSRMVN
ncbi:MAG: DUF1631 family protein [Brachymonas sp.]